MNISRRNFLKVGAAGAATSWLMNLPTIAHAAEGEDYKALVCVFMVGGNDHNNTIIPYDQDNYKQYRLIRPEIAVDQKSIKHLMHLGTLPYKQTLGLNENMVEMQTLFHAGKMAVQLNVGPLFKPMTKEQYTTEKNALPPKLFSHNDQQSLWQASQAEGAKRGWGGTSNDAQFNKNAHDIFSCISIAGSSVFLSGEKVSQLNISPIGMRPIIGTREQDTVWGSRDVALTFKSLILGTRQHPMENEFVNVTKRAISAESILDQALIKAGVKDKDILPDNIVKQKLGKQLNMVAKIIKARAGTKAKRQVFFVKLGGFDNHDNLIENHGNLLKDVSSSIKAFYDATVSMGVANNVTTFTASDFGRTFVSNGDGSDHGWGSHHFIVGGAVKGRRFYGTPPKIDIGSKDYIGKKGRLLPTTSVDQYAATLANWFGVPYGDPMRSVAPNLDKFDVKDLGFLKK